MTNELAGVIVGGAITTLALLVKEAIDYFKSDKQFKQSLKKELFIKKLNAFEKTVAYYNIAQATISNMATIFKSIRKEDVYYSAEEVQRIMAVIQKNLDDVYKNTQETALAIGLYTDYDFSEKDESYAQRFFDRIGEINQIGFDINITEMFIETADSAGVERGNKEIVRLFELMESKITELDDLNKLIKPKYKGVAKLLRSELKKYDS